MTASEPAYCFDTSAWLDGWVRHYSMENFPSVWDRIADLLRSGRGWWTEEVTAEIKEVDLIEWLKPHGAAVIPTSDVWTEASALQQRFNHELSPKGITGADPFVIAAARINALWVVTGEKPSTGRPKIPDVCNELGIRYTSLADMIRKEGWTF